MRKFVCLIVFLALVGEVPGSIYLGRWESPWSIVGNILLVPLVKLPLIDLIAVGVTVMNRPKLGPKHTAPPLMKYIRLCLLTTLGLWVWGVITGGNAYQTQFQLHGFLMIFAMATMVLTVMRTQKDLHALGMTIVLAAMARGAMAFFFYFYMMPVLNMHVADFSTGFCVTTHSDTALFVTGILIPVAYALENPTKKTVGFALFVLVYLAIVIQINNRRLAWVSLIVGFIVLYAMLPQGKIKAGVRRGALYLAPFMVAYIVVGWGRTEGIFKPVGSLSTMFGKKEDASSETRNIENYNLIQTLKVNPLLGVGWGHEYREISIAYSIAEIFPQYRYIPHNSVLGLLAFTGLLGFAGTWMFLPVTVFLATRGFRVSKNPVERAASLVAVSEVAIYANQAYGDMGLGTTTCTLLMACGMAVAGRVPVMCGAWPGTKPKVEPSEGAEPALPGAPASEQPAVEVREGERPGGDAVRHVPDELLEGALRVGVAGGAHREHDGQDDDRHHDDLRHGKARS